MCIYYWYKVQSNTSGLAVFDYESRLTQDLPIKQQKKDGH
jgi:hypothetical protein